MENDNKNSILMDDFQSYMDICWKKRGYDDEKMYSLLTAYYAGASTIAKVLAGSREKKVSIEATEDVIAEQVDLLFDEMGTLYEELSNPNVIPFPK